MGRLGRLDGHGWSHGVYRVAGPGVGSALFINNFTVDFLQSFHVKGYSRLEDMLPRLDQRFLLFVVGGHRPQHDQDRMPMIQVLIPWNGNYFLNHAVYIFTAASTDLCPGTRVLGIVLDLWEEKVRECGRNINCQDLGLIMVPKRRLVIYIGLFRDYVPLWRWMDVTLAHAPYL